ncbi:MAG: CDP-diacylglycerol--glycerol-3-phosphate 3-phosphatidyltransferase [Chroococcidiopsis cubana SAG 39.79]|jgi:CDP-diacylglycerol---glycerol-3-phosphate 3-phosphatidyltransferase|uniref:CDP-diacylglycerol--glycerol-3-phosphate 3-phosphatidyltransferase n=1 Tax=Chroococcidiopsis thermalis (strain PCC 7203) TaxID=251229 RepID=K9U2T5_CHRTP|nr:MULTISPECIES: CDP-diacylglycerol--glycerol-3-phosphate 3-phosphatidyltransferase [Chroococcidiopsis]PSB40385.1 CDP-diacylglycerol--glycerol-3-phosphate 3-phosphatidyltransferase [Cyanosarcina cf. burmensis CCALA 770]AFY88554.1 CDP-diacylglycerol--glycerol-3-phosphate 3-phosphatidyltransferase [Chroococcidiopsis thermalis PCC 7203]MDZ4871721.1 CDP-diacylglycerol--glycerol-3-phosphate 3-phosphatidyltransferase [Chroococcidiopsis cubana SAG 39.79]PSB57291.1 CDP-diacylglycerol--glycerol-3-phosph
MNIPNWVTLSRLLALPLLLYLLPVPTTTARWFCLTVFLVAALTDWLDGYLARKLNAITELGKFLDPLVDKLLVLAPLLSLIQLGQLPAWGVFLILARELGIAGWRVSPSLTGTNAIAGANLWGKLKTVSQITAIALLIAPLPPTWHLPALGVFWLSVALTLISGLIYFLGARSEERGARGIQES